MAGGDFPPVAVATGRDREADEQLLKKQKPEPEQPQPQPAAEEAVGVNPLNPRYSEYDPKQREHVYTRFCFDPRLDLNKESPYGPMRHTHKTFGEGFPLSHSANILSVKIVSSDYGYPLNVYGTVIARDDLDRKCVYLFRRDKKNRQSITSEDNSLILTGPKRGLALCGSLFFEINLKVKDVHGREVKDERLSKGMLQINGIIRQTSNFEYGVETDMLVSMHSTLEMNFAFVRDAVEGTVGIRILEGPVDFHGKIIATTTRVLCETVLHDSRANGLLTAGNNQVMQTACRVVCVSVGEMLLVTVAPEGGDELSHHTVSSTCYASENMVCGNYKMQLKVTWSIVM
ncbi:hypothetical protein CFC21_104570 [Triticum aestivum]|uniref:DUF6598 domain-containing protein n=2 Tax=Triticum aestivum TaxID=4565 RepID=A0A9R1MAG5_WHEAT|nr:hypothetical protein CFC21_104568 [Triticum aestivum]KAF7103596.1 hypothetical protein CFC21_104570 [Triticum aestivum]